MMIRESDMMQTKKMMMIRHLAAHFEYIRKKSEHNSHEGSGSSCIERFTLFTSAVSTLLFGKHSYL